MKLSVRWKEAAELIGIAAVVGSVIFVGLELMAARQIALSEGDRGTVAAGIEVESQIQAHAEIWQKAAIDMEQLDEVESVIFKSIVNSSQAFFFTAYRSVERIQGEEAAGGWRRNFALFLYSNPGARVAWEEQEDRLLRARDIMNPGGANLSEWKAAVLADLEALDSAGL